MKKAYIKPSCTVINMEPIRLMASTITRQTNSTMGRQMDATSDKSSSSEKKNYGSQMGEQVGEEGTDYFGSGSLIGDDGSVNFN